MLKGRLGLERARIPHADRHGLLWLERGELCVVDGCLHFGRSGGAQGATLDQIPHQAVSMILLGLGSSVTHDALRLLARMVHCWLRLVRMVSVVILPRPSCPTDPMLQDDKPNDVAIHAAGSVWRGICNALRLGEVLPHRDLDTLRGIEGARVKRIYRLMADKHGIEWNGRHYDRANPEAADIPNQALNHAATAVQAAAALAVQAIGALPPLGFIHEDSGQSFVLDIADLFRDTLTLEIAFTAARKFSNGATDTVDRLVRREAAISFRKQQVIPSMIERIKQVLRLEQANGADDDSDT